MECEVIGLYYYPVKSLAAISCSELLIDSFGFLNDRRFMLIDSSGRFVTQRKYPQLSQVRALFNGESLSLSNNKNKSVTFHLREFCSEQGVIIWQDSVNASALGELASARLSQFLELDLRLVYMPESTYRQVDRDFFKQDQRVSFVDGFPFLLTNQASLADLNQRLQTAVDMLRFRPNIVVEGAAAFEEDNWSEVEIGSVRFRVVKPCSRCVMTTIDAEGLQDPKREPLKTLSGYRKNEFGVCFGQNMVHLTQGMIRLGDKLQVIS